MRPSILEIRLPTGPTAEDLELLRTEGHQPVRLQIPEDWCYRIRWPAPPSGWTEKQRDELRPSLFPEPLDLLSWDEAIDDKGDWVLWALPTYRLERAVQTFAVDLWQEGRVVRACPEGHLDHASSMAAFPNVAPQPFRAKRLPWKRILTVGLIGVPLLVLAAGGLVIGGVVLPRWRALEARKHLAETTLTQGQTRLVQERQQLQQLKGLETNQGAQPRWVRDLDALTRLLPEDSHLVGLRWDPEGIQIDLVTPNPELIRSILEAAPDFMEVRFQGNLDRHGDQSRLTLSLKPETPR